MEGNYPQNGQKVPKFGVSSGFPGVPLNSPEIEVEKRLLRNLAGGTSAERGAGTEGFFFELRNFLRRMLRNFLDFLLKCRGFKQIRGYLGKKAIFLRFLDFRGALQALRKRAKKAEKG